MTRDELLDLAKDAHARGSEDTAKEYEYWAQHLTPDEDDAAAELESSTHYEASMARRLGVSVSQLRREQKEADDAQD